ncbi:hypothetical protein [Heliophilum fasciatum]|uniref:Uncharacterized protein n=1 Tax=Heliophilum fasciatum TaxID=35700 RepID=A0A4R2RHN1_9FIRM|nr:hypothetical protein [Heliophilum fasciatum]MCW2278758.1 hypothetical protein [Heliophilum fasciatum]TCP62503.1 hypothetical protein EDD73_1211 [Heliophilum fasciatum]
MARIIDMTLINKTALMCDQDPSEESLARLLELMAPVVEHTARKYSRLTGLELNLIISELEEVVWKASVGYDGRSAFTQRFHTYAKDKEIDFIRYCNRLKRTLCTEVSMDAPLRSAENLSYKNLFEDRFNLEEEVIAKVDIEKKLAGFTRTNEQFGKILELMLLESVQEPNGTKYGIR